MTANNTSLVEKYVAELTVDFKTGQAREHAYRPALKKLFEKLDSSITAVNDPKQSEYGAPDFVFIRSDVIAGYAEAKNITEDLEKTRQSEQLERYFGYSNLILTNYLEFHFFRNGEPYGEAITIGEVRDSKLVSDPDNFAMLGNTLVEFLQGKPEPIKSGKKLAKIMAGKARRIHDNIKRFLKNESEQNEELLRVFESIKKTLVHDLDADAFADMYAQTLVYGLFAARYNDETPDNFSRQEARDLVSDSTPFLRDFFDHIVGPNFDKRLAYIVDELTDVFAIADVHKIMHEYFKADDLWGKTHEGLDPVIHFYEDFLQEYDTKLRKRMGAFYTPLPVVRFIVRSIDMLLKKEFNLSGGLADTTKTGDKTHKVQILDPAVGTGTFLSEVLHSIYDSFKNGQKGRWTSYVFHDLLPRLHGFELMMAPYTIAHLKLTMLLNETGFTTFNKRRLGIYLTNSLEPGFEQENSLFSLGFAHSIAEEAKEAAVVKNERPIMVVFGNPPYAGESSNAFYTGHDVYKVEPTGGKLKEKNSKWLNDDYVKFIRLAESFIEKNGEGVVAMITAHGYLDNPTFRGMRWHLMHTFDSIYVLDLHGNANKKEKAPDGGEDKNVFDIKTGVAIILAVKRKDGANEETAKIFRADCYGLREAKFTFLDSNTLETVGWQVVTPHAPNYEWAVRNVKLAGEYEQGFLISELFPVSSVGVVTSRDKFVTDMDREKLSRRVQEFLQSASSDEALSRFGLRETQKWKASEALRHQFDENNIIPVSYRPFDIRFVYYHDDFIERSRREVMSHLLAGENLGLVTVNRSPHKTPVSYYFVSEDIISNGYIRSDSVSIDTMYPLYLYAEDGSRQPNFKREIVDEIEKIVGKTKPENILDYTYAILHSPEYREKYQEFLKIDFPRVPYPKDKDTFWKLVELGRELRMLHLLESPKVSDFITTFPESGTDEVEQVKYKSGNVYINDTQYFGDVPEIAWNFYIGGYQPAQKWLKDRKGRELTNEDIEHYQKIIVVLAETDKVMKQIDKVLEKCF